VGKKAALDIGRQISDVTLLKAATPASLESMVEKLQKRIEKRHDFQPKNPLDRNDVSVLAGLISTIIGRVPQQMWEAHSSTIKFLGSVKSVTPIAETGFKGTSDFIGRFRLPEQVERGTSFAEDYFLRGVSLEDLEERWKIGAGTKGPKGVTGRSIIKNVVNAIKTNLFVASFPQKVQELIDAIAEDNDGLVLDLAQKHQVNTTKLEQIKKRYSVLVDASLCGSDETCK
jgi:hypothetical protein